MRWTMTKMTITTPNSPVYKFLNWTYIKLANWSVFPGGRHREDGPFSAVEFLEEILLPNIDTKNGTILDLTDTRGIGSNFLQELFYGLRRHYSKEEIHNFLHIRGSESIRKESWRYIDGAREKKIKPKKRKLIRKIRKKK